MRKIERKMLRRRWWLGVHKLTRIRCGKQKASPKIPPKPVGHILVAGMEWVQSHHVVLAAGNFCFSLIANCGATAKIALVFPWISTESYLHNIQLTLQLSKLSGKTAFTSSFPRLCRTWNVRWINAKEGRNNHNLRSRRNRSEKGVSSRPFWGKHEICNTNNQDSLGEERLEMLARRNQKLFVSYVIFCRHHKT